MTRRALPTVLDRLNIVSLLGGVALSGLAAAAQAADVRSGEVPGAEVPAPRFFVHVGASGIFTDTASTVRVAGVAVPGASVSIDDQAAFAVEVGWRLTPNVALALTGGLPMVTAMKGAGAIAATGTAGKSLNGPVVATLQYHFDGWGAVQPYVGAGPAYLHIFDNRDGSLSRFEVRDNLGFVLQAGADVMLNRNWGVFVDVKKSFIDTTSTGYMGPFKVKSDVHMDAVALFGGLTYRF